MIKALLLGGAAGVFAAAAFCCSFALAGARLNPGLAAQLGPAGGPAAAMLAAGLVRDRQTSTGGDVRSGLALDLARAAYVREPLSSTALRVLALESRYSDPGAALVLLEAGHALSRRNTELSADLLAEYARLGRNAEGLAVLDELLRRDTAFHGELLERMAAGVGGTMLGDYRRLLARKPPWADDFWRQLAQSPDGLANAAALRVGFAEDAGKVDPEIDGLLVAGLAEAGRYDDAWTVASIAFLMQRRSGNGLLLNAGFERAPVAPPLDWQLAHGADHGGSIEEGRLLVSALGGARGEAARRLVKLPAGRIRLAVAADGSAAETAGWIRASLACAAPNGGMAQELASATVGAPREFAIPARCRWAWLRLMLAVPSDAEDLEIAIDNVALLPLGAGRRAES